MSDGNSSGQRLAVESGAVLAWFQIPETGTDTGSNVQLFFPDGRIQQIRVPKFSDADLLQLTGDWEDAHQRYLEDVRTNERLALVHRKDDRQAMLRILRELYDRLLAPMHEALRADPAGVKGGLLLLPEKELSRLPLHACCWVEETGVRYLVDDFTISYAPQFEFFETSLAMERRAKRHKLLAVGNPQKDLDFSQLEFEIVHRTLGTENCALLLGRHASRSNVMHLMTERHWFHFACHCEFNKDRPSESKLHLAGKDYLRVSDIVDRGPLAESYLVFLSGCESGLYSVYDQVGFPTAFLRIGVPTVYATLWVVHDFFTLFLVRRTYEELHNTIAKVTKPLALRKAQTWLRDLTVDRALQWLSDWQQIAGPEQKATLARCEAHFDILRRRFGADHLYFDYPRTWGAFQCLGT